MPACAAGWQPQPAFLLANPFQFPTMRRYLLAALVLSCWIPRAVAQQDMLREVYDPKTKTQIVVKSLFGILPQHGYTPIRATIHNGTTSARTWTFAFKGDSQTPYGMGDNGMTMASTFSVTVEPGANGTFDFSVPMPTALEGSVYGGGVELSCTVSATGLATVSGSLSEGVGEGSQVLISEKLHTPNGSALDNHASSVSSHGSGMSTTFGGAFVATELPHDWRAFLGFDLMLITEDEWLSIQPGARNAILTWNRLGGHITIYSTRSGSDLASLHIGDDGRGLRDLARSKGKVSIKSIGADLDLDEAAVVADAAALPAAVKAIREDYNSTWNLQDLFGAQGFNYGIFVIVLLVFGILVGPVNLFVFAKSGKRHRMFFTTPLISLGASLLLVVLIILQDGFGGHGMRFVHMEVRPDAGENLAYIQQEQIVRTGVLLSSKHTLPETGFVTGVPLRSSPWARLTTDYNSRGGRYNLEQDGAGLKASGDWYQSRSEHGHLLTALRPTRGRIELEAGSQPPRLISSFDFPINVLVFRDADGGCWRAENLNQGQPTACTSLTGSAYDAAVSDFSAPASASAGKAIHGLAKRRSHFLAQADSAPALESYQGIDWLKTLTVITGPLQAP
jgi:hypothetical protein